VIVSIDLSKHLLVPLALINDEMDGKKDWILANDYWFGYAVH
jgi:hypothetical protein